MTRLVNKLADRLVGMVAPKAHASAAAALICSEVFCYCQGARYFAKQCCYQNGKYECYVCRFVGNGC
ncbi:hypothetical protein [Nonomuraea jiangxiensis]|nr:hypothetical protein [Nonomuraea jiangxiensis]